MEKDRPPFRGLDSLSDPSRLREATRLVGEIPRITRGKYLPWRKIRHRAKDGGVDPAAFWCALKIQRIGGTQSPGLVQADGRTFTFNVGPHLLEPLHRIDRATGGGGAWALNSQHGVLADESHRTRLRIKTLMDEAAESSLIEGAATTRRAAVEMLRSERAPKNKGEWMVANNYAAMQRVKEWVRRPLSKEMLLELQAILTKNTLGNENESGRFRRTDENVRIEDSRSGEEIWVPPPAETLERRLASLCDFANANHDGSSFIHPIVKASILHFMIGYEHPFVDGNGRTARAVFYWFALRNGYDVFEFIPISERIRKGFARYPQAYIDTELDEGDLTYFILYQLDIIELALDDLAQHLHDEEEKVRSSERILKLNKNLNLRQRLLIEHGLRHPQTVYTVISHMTSNDIVKATARSDLSRLVKLRLMVTSKRGKEVTYHIAPGLADRLAKKGI